MRWCGLDSWEQHSKEEWCGTSQRQKDVRNPIIKMIGRPGHIPSGNVYNWSKHTTLPTSQSPWTNNSTWTFKSSSGRDLCLRTQLTGLRPSVATHFLGGFCILCVVALNLKGFYITLVSHTVTGSVVIPWGKDGKGGGQRSKLDRKPPVFYTDFFLSGKSTCIHTQRCVWLTSVKISKCKTSYN